MLEAIRVFENPVQNFGDIVNEYSFKILDYHHLSYNSSNLYSELMFNQNELMHQSLNACQSFDQGDHCSIYCTRYTR